MAYTGTYLNAMYNAGALPARLNTSADKTPPYSDAAFEDFDSAPCQYVDPRATLRDLDAITGSAPAQFQAQHSNPGFKPAKVSADMLDDAEGPQAPSPAESQQPDTDLPGGTAEADFAPPAADSPEEPPAQHGITACGSDLPAEEVVDNLEEVTKYQLDEEYYAKAIFVLENPGTKLTRDHLPPGLNSVPASWKFSIKEKYELGLGPGGDTILFWKKAEEPAKGKQRVPRRDQIWEVLCKEHKDDKTGRHCGRDRMKSRINAKYYGITKNMIIAFLDACPVCEPRRKQVKGRLAIRTVDPRPTKKARTAASMPSSASQ